MIDETVFTDKEIKSIYEINGYLVVDDIHVEQKHLIFSKRTEYKTPIMRLFDPNGKEILRLDDDGKVNHDWNYFSGNKWLRLHFQSFMLPLRQKMMMFPELYKINQ